MRNALRLISHILLGEHEMAFFSEAESLFMSALCFVVRTPPSLK